MEIKDGQNIKTQQVIEYIKYVVEKSKFYRKWTGNKQLYRWFRESLQKGSENRKNMKNMKNRKNRKNKKKAEGKKWLITLFQCKWDLCDF